MVALKQIYQVLLLMPLLLWVSNPDKPRWHFIVFIAPDLLTMPSPQHPPPCKTSAPICENGDGYRHIWWGREMEAVSTTVKPQCHIVNLGPPPFPPRPVSHTLISLLPIHDHSTAKAASPGRGIDTECRSPPSTPKESTLGFLWEI